MPKPTKNPNPQIPNPNPNPNPPKPIPSGKNLILPPIVCKPIVKGQQNISMLAPLAGMIHQDSTPHVSPWQFIGAGSAMQVTLTVTDLVGTVSICLETVGTVGNPPRFLGAFQEIAATPCTLELVGPAPVSDDYVRVISTPGLGAGQTCSWTVAGQAIVPFAPIT